MNWLQLLGKFLGYCIIAAIVFFIVAIVIGILAASIVAVKVAIHLFTFYV